MSLPGVVTLDGDGGFGGPHNEEAGVPSSDVELTLDLVPVRMVFTEAVRPSLLDIEIIRLHCLFNGCCFETGCKGSNMDVAVAEEPLRKIFRAKKTMKVSDRRQLESLHTTLSSPCSIPSPPQPAMVNGKQSEDVSMEVDKETHGATHPTTPAPSSLTATSLTTETSEESSTSALLVPSSQNIHSDVKDVQEDEGEGDKESTLPSLEVEDKMNGVMKGDRDSKEDVIPASPVSSEKTEAVREKEVDDMEIDLVPESDQEVRPGFLVLSDDDDVQDESDEEEKDEKEKEQRESEEGGVEKVEVNMEKPEQFESGAPVDCPSPSSPIPRQIDEEEEGAALQRKRSLSGDSEDGGQKQGERDVEVVERHHKRPRVDCEELEAHVELKISGSAERQHKLKKVVQHLVEEQLRVLQLTLFDKSLQGLRDRVDKIEKHPSALSSLQAKIARLSKKVGTANQARENAKKPPEVPLPPTSTNATATTSAGSAILCLRTMGNNTQDPMRNDQSSQTPTPVRNDQSSQTPYFCTHSPLATFPLFHILNWISTHVPNLDAEHLCYPSTRPVCLLSPAIPHTAAWRRDSHPYQPNQLPANTHRCLHPAEDYSLHPCRSQAPLRSHPLISFRCHTHKYTHNHDYTH
ncbi:hypothetical protein J4Q44_G00174750 [Coregonus suidteri]|uniref:ATF7-interacting protein protein binding domain-containing protein n=1 Tax=Coregonus suidteri TaxID=861788 RepID=A0AAN8QUK7_9TELE